MTRLIEILIALAIVAVLFLVVGLALPSERHLTERVETNRKLPIVYDTLASMRRFDDWNTVVARDPTMERTITGPESGEGATFSYESQNPDVGSGSWTIVEAVPGERIVYAIENNHAGTDKTMTVTLEPTGRNNRNVEITQRYSVDYGWNILGRYEGLYVSRNVGDAMQMDMGRLGNMLATVPNFDYTQLTVKPKMVERPAENVLYVESTVDRDNDVVQNQMATNRQWIQQVMASNNLEAAGPLQVVTVEFGTENYAFELAQPVRKAGSGPSGAANEAADEADAGEGEEVEAEVADAAPAADATPIEVDLAGPVQYRLVPRHRAATTEVKGHMANLPNFRDALRAWALTHGEETTGRPYESWRDGISASFDHNGEAEFDLYWPVKD